MNEGRLPDGQLHREGMSVPVLCNQLEVPTEHRRISCRCYPVKAASMSRPLVARNDESFEELSNCVVP